MLVKCIAKEFLSLADFFVKKTDEGIIVAILMGLM